MTGWKEHIIYHVFGFVVFTLPLMWVMTHFVFEVAFLPLVPWVALGAAIGVFLVGVFKYGLP